MLKKLIDFIRGYKEYKVIENNIEYDVIEYNNGDKMYWVNGKLHREDGPAIEYANGSRAYFINGISYSEEDYYNEINQTEELEEGQYYVDHSIQPCPNCENPAYADQPIAGETKFICNSVIVEYKDEDGEERARLIVSNECLFYGNKCYDITKGYVH